MSLLVDGMLEMLAGSLDAGLSLCGDRYFIDFVKHLPLSHSSSTGLIVQNPLVEVGDVLSNIYRALECVKMNDHLIARIHIRNISLDLSKSRMG